MKLILDTHVLIWWFEDPGQLSTDVRDVIAEPENNVLVSVVAAWEIAIKRKIGKLSAPDDLEGAVHESGFEWLSIHPRHALATESLPFHHRDPFDRMLIAQAIVEDAILVSRDPQLTKYGVGLMLA